MDEKSIVSKRLTLKDAIWVNLVAEIPVQRARVILGEVAYGGDHTLGCVVQNKTDCQSLNVLAQVVPLSSNTRAP